jgi:hypothetical protein
MCYTLDYARDRSAHPGSVTSYFLELSLKNSIDCNFELEDNLGRRVMKHIDDIFIGS